MHDGSVRLSVPWVEGGEYCSEFGHIPRPAVAAIWRQFFDGLAKGMLQWGLPNAVDLTGHGILIRFRVICFYQT
jgi:hypothetical protein